MMEVGKEGTCIEDDGKVFATEVATDALIAEDIVTEVTTYQISFQGTPSGGVGVWYGNDVVVWVWKWCGGVGVEMV